MDPVLLCKELGAEGLVAQTGASSVQSSGRSSMSVKEAVQIARSNNFMGLVCSWRLLVSQSSTCTDLVHFQRNVLTAPKKKKEARTVTHRSDQNSRPSANLRSVRLERRYHLHWLSTTTQWT